MSQTLDAVLHKGQMMPEKNRFPVILMPFTFSFDATMRPGDRSTIGEIQPTVTSNSRNAVATEYTLRRLTPLESERLQGFPDEYTNIPKAADTPRYKAIGNSMTVHVMRWIGRRIQLVDNIIKKQNSI